MNADVYTMVAMAHDLPKMWAQVEEILGYKP